MRRALLALAVTASTPALAQDSASPDIPTFRLYYESLTAARYNPLGLQEQLGLYARVRLMDSDSVLFNDTYVMVGPAVSASPAFVQPGLHVQAMPIALLRLGARMDYVQYFGTFDQVLTWDEPAPDWSDTAIDARSANDEEGPASGYLATLDVRLQAKVGPIATRYTWTGRGMFLDVADDAVVYYDQTPDVAAPVRGWTFLHDTDLLFAPEGKPFVLGARWTATAPLLEGSHGTMHRVGPLFAYKFPSTQGAAFSEPALLVISQFHAKHPFRTGQDVSPAIPYLLVAFAFKGDLIPW